MGFDEETLQPTYELKIGVPGASAGINIAQRLGLNPAIIESARARLGTQARDVGQFLDRLHADLREAETERAAPESARAGTGTREDHLAAEGKKEQQAKVREMEQKLESVLRDFEYHAREAVNAVQDRAAAQKVSKDAERRIAKLRREFREQFDSTVVAHATGADRGDPNAQPQVVKHVVGRRHGETQVDRTPGERSSARSTTIISKLQVGPMKMRIARDDIAEVVASVVSAAHRESRAGGALQRNFGLTGERRHPASPREINVIGRTVDEATREVEKFVDRAFLAGLPRVRVVHGSGMGILRKALRQSLQQHPHVETVAEPPQNEGGAGATVVELRV